MTNTLLILMGKKKNTKGGPPTGASGTSGATPDNAQAPAGKAQATADANQSSGGADKPVDAVKKEDAPTDASKGSPSAVGGEEKKEEDKAVKSGKGVNAAGSNDKGKGCKTVENTHEPSVKRKPYPEVKEPTASQKKRREEQLEKDKKAKIAAGVYQSRSDEDDTLEKVKSLNEERTEKSMKSKKK